MSSTNLTWISPSLRIPERSIAGDITFAGQTLTFTQAAGTGDTSVCTYTLNPPSATLSSVAGNYTVQVTPSAQKLLVFCGFIRAVDHRCGR